MFFDILTHGKPLEQEERYLVYAIRMTKHLERTIEMADVATNPFVALRKLGVQLLDFMLYFLQLL